jgi:hypothetical protein
MTVLAGLAPWHHHRAEYWAVVAGGVGNYEVCRCRKSRQCCGDRWRRRQPAGPLTVTGVAR